MNPVKFVWVPLYFVSAIILAVIRNESYLESLVVVLPVFTIGLIVALGMYFSFKRKKWTWYHIVNVAGGVTVVWVCFVSLIFSNSGQDDVSSRSTHYKEHDWNPKYIEPKEQDWASLVTKAEELTRTRPDDASVWSYLGRAYCESGRLEEAIKSYKQSLSINPDCEITWNNLGYSYQKSGNYDQAIHAYKESLRIDPGCDITWNSLGRINFETGSYDEAIKDYLESLGIHPENDITWNNLGYTYQQAGRFGQAIQAYRESLRINSDNGIALHNLGYAYIQIGEIRNAMEVHGRLCRIDSALADNLMYLIQNN